MILIIAVSGCRTTRFVPENEYLLDNVIIKNDNRKINSDELYIYVQQKSNKKVMYFTRLHLHVYNILCNQSGTGPINWIGKTVGEPPVIYDRFLTQKTIDQLKIHLANKGYYNAEIKDSLVYNDRSVTLYYVIKSNNPYIIKSVNYRISDDAVAKIVLSDTVNSQIKSGHIFDIDIFDLERQRISRCLKEHGYYYFNPGTINYTADTTIKDNMVDIVSNIGILNNQQGKKEPSTNATKPCYIRNINIYPSFDPKKAILEGTSYTMSFDTIEVKNYKFMVSNNIDVKPELVLKSLAINSGERYDIRKVEETNRYLNATGFFKLINIRFDTPLPLSDTALSVDCIIQLTPFTIQSYTVEVDGSSTANNFEAALNLSYQHRNLFKGAEMLNLKLKGAAQIVTEGVRTTSDKLQFNSYEYSAETSIDFPNFLAPFVKDSFYKRYRPLTSVGGSFNFQNQPNYTRTILKSNFGYYWNSSKSFRHIVTPIELNSVRFPIIDSSYLAVNTYRKKDFDNYFISSSWYSLIFSNQQLKSLRNYIYFRYNIELAGNILTSAFKLLNKDKVDGSYVIDGTTQIAQFLKTEIDIRYYHVLNQDNRAIFRIHTGVGLPYGNISSMPYVTQYHAGGANDVRAWQIGRLGPGSYSDSTLFPNQTANFKLTGNFEYRFKIIWMFEGAFFIDIGNIWSLNKNEQRENTKFRADRFYKEFAIGSGLGLRVDLNFLLIRLDNAIKVRNPSIASHNGWLPFNHKYTENDFQFHIGIGYPF